MKITTHATHYIITFNLIYTYTFFSYSIFSLQLLVHFSKTVRLVGGNNRLEGRAEIYYGGRWGAICDNMWTMNDANVFCRMLNYSSASSSKWLTRFGKDIPMSDLRHVYCKGSELLLTDCAYEDRTLPPGGYCIRSEKVGVKCTPEGTA